MVIEGELDLSDEQDAAAALAAAARAVAVPAKGLAALDMAFSKSRVEDRKDWLRGLDPEHYVDHSLGEFHNASLTPF
jgi:hypothetical protein